ncbi:flavodoxin and oxidoreductase NAD-binding domain containing protein, putative [Babesia bigemina]|uniref:NADPH--hemoprotein reductase n=1 Tax=Babesia bigemina TaxID=5866 RepID=A0A061D4K1_BABBI|nr:flavodoxin and oxidoreductase NAD-binding domain containing protein, putative [Babesia bigemina]CDR95503.1 flavodoxin and oxidoreductase NAD-binding domain containing protein, putative [Babesia bigemina]|eukprot:XP_012767689.1 flavodoxin and oxidoreductase NAD-binding domain containing protein, putative [Babesia bigemina]
MPHITQVTLSIVATALAVYVTYELWKRAQPCSSDPAEQEGGDSPQEPHTTEIEPPKVESDAQGDISRVYIYYGSQTGTAERFARALALQLAEWNEAFRCNAINLEDWEDEKISQPGATAIFTVATHDDGLFPDNATDFVKWLGKRGKDGSALRGLRFCIFGLGSSEYPLFNRAAKTLQTLLNKAGAQEILSIALGDDAGDLKGDFNQWTIKLCEKLANDFNIPPPQLSVQSRGKLLKVTDSWRDKVPLELRYVSSSPADRPRQPNIANVVCKQQWQCVDHVVLDNFNMTPNGDSQTNCLRIKPDSAFSPAETVNILYANPPHVVKYFMGKLRLKDPDLDRVITFVPRYGSTETQMDFEPPFPVPCTIRDALLYYLDLTELPDEDVLEEMGTFLQTAPACQLFNKMLNSKSLIKRMREELHVTLPEFVEIFMEDALFNLGGFLQIVKKKVPKAYTISSHPKTNSIDCTVKLVTFPIHSFKSFRSSLKKTVGYKVSPAAGDFFVRQRNYEGACTHYLCSLKQGDSVKLFRRPSAFSSVEGLDARPLVMIANGAGVAPFRAFWQNGRNDLKRILFLGFRTEAHILYAEEVEQLKAMPNYTVHIALSRSKTPMYVQHILRKHMEEVVDILKNDGVVCVCGSKPMGAQVKAIIQHFTKTDIAELKADGRFIEELW